MKTKRAEAYPYTKYPKSPLGKGVQVPDRGIAIFWVCLANFAAINLCAASQGVFAVVRVKCDLQISNSWFEGTHLRYVLIETQKNCIGNASEKTWIYSYDPETKQQFSQWKRPTSPRPTKASHVSDCQIIRHYYREVLQRLREQVRRKRP
jgi:hypothetical protein